jgi:hypothetical protein
LFLLQRSLRLLRPRASIIRAHRQSVSTGSDLDPSILSVKEETTNSPALYEAAETLKKLKE